MPVYWLGEVMNLITQSRLHDTWLFSWVPGLGYKPLLEDPLGWFKTMVIPWFTLAVLYIGLYGRVLRASLVEALQEDYIRTARSKGISETRVLLRHALRTSLITFVSMFGLDFGALVGGAALLTEVVFGLQGVGKLTYDALHNLDLPVIMATVMYASFFVVAANAAVDLVYAVLDPRIRAADSSSPAARGGWQPGPLREARIPPARGARPQGVVPHAAWAGARGRRRLLHAWRRARSSASSASPARARPSRS